MAVGHLGEALRLATPGGSARGLAGRGAGEGVEPSHLGGCVVRDVARPLPLEVGEVLACIRPPAPLLTPLRASLVGDELAWHVERKVCDVVVVARGLASSILIFTAPLLVRGRPCRWSDLAYVAAIVAGRRARGLLRCGFFRRRRRRCDARDALLRTTPRPLARRPAGGVPAIARVARGIVAIAGLGAALRVLRLAAERLLQLRPIRGLPVARGLVASAATDQAMLAAPRGLRRAPHVLPILDAELAVVAPREHRGRRRGHRRAGRAAYLVVLATPLLFCIWPILLPVQHLGLAIPSAFVVRQFAAGADMAVLATPCLLPRSPKLYAAVIRGDAVVRVLFCTSAMLLAVDRRQASEPLLRTTPTLLFRCPSRLPCGHALLAIEQGLLSISHGLPRHRRRRRCEVRATLALRLATPSALGLRPLRPPMLSVLVAIEDILVDRLVWACILDLAPLADIALLNDLAVRDRARAGFVGHPVRHQPVYPVLARGADAAVGADRAAILLVVRASDIRGFAAVLLLRL
mmetsp:Transcript_55216/g.159907  ORF Transcript_55216/g.159907 Transcript_55216/m.159907 type:complete len:521 (+) Transcript_55216:351-1913(+)